MAWEENSSSVCQMLLPSPSFEVTGDPVLPQNNQYLLTYLPLDKVAAISQTIFHMLFLDWKVLYFDSNFTEVCSQGSNWQQPSIGSDNGLAPNRRQAIIWTNVDPIHWHIYAALGGAGGDELKQNSVFVGW